MPPTDDEAGSDPGAPRDPTAGKRPYEKPRIVWREPYEPVAFGVSCAKQPGNPGCPTGPFTS